MTSTDQTSIRTDPNTQSTLASMTFQSLLTSVDGRQVAKKLVTALIEQQIGQELGVSCLYLIERFAADWLSRSILSVRSYNSAVVLSASLETSSCTR